MAALHKTRFGPLLGALAVLALTAGAVVLLVRLDETRATERQAAEAQAAALRAADGVRGIIGGIEVQTQNATTNPRLVAALDANVDQETIRDLLLTEPWWEPFRRAMDGYGLFADESTPIVASRLPAGLDPKSFIREARQGHRASSGMVLASGQVLTVTACPIALTGRSDWPVLLAIKALDVGLVSGAAERAGGAVAISDGRRLLVAAAPSSSSGTHDVAAIKQALDLPAPGLRSVDGAVIAALPLQGGLRVLVAVVATNTSGGMPVPWSVIAILVIGVTFSIGLFVMLGRFATEAPGEESTLGTQVDALTAIGRYTLVDRIGQGGMAEIYSAVTTGEGTFRRPVVIKRLRPELTVDPTAVAQFCDEANLLAALHHPNIVSVHDFGRTQNQYFLAEEYVPGRDLGRIITRRFARAHRALPLEVVAYIGSELLKGLEYAHTLCNEQGRPLEIVHRDISPENLMISTQGEVKLLDFGVVKAAEGRVSKTEMGVVKGNVTYMSPEQARGLEVDARADLYSTALVLYVCCTGRPLYAADTTYGLLMKAGAGPGVEERAGLRSLPRPFCDVIDRATAQRIEDRYARASEMMADLEPFARGGSSAMAAIVSELFGAEIKEEAHRLAAYTPESGTRTVAGASS